MVSIDAAFSPDGARILTASADNTAKLWDAASGKLIASFDHQDTVRWAAFSPDGARILTASWDKTAKLWDAATPVELARQVKESGGEHSENRLLRFDGQLTRAASRIALRYRKRTRIFRRRLARRSQ